eukprot:Gb_19656 [translate_table: standard]
MLLNSGHCKPQTATRLHANRIEDPSFIRILDTTLRDGEQCPGAAMTVQQKGDVERQLDIIDAGFPSASPSDAEAVKLIAKEVEKWWRMLVVSDVRISNSVPRMSRYREMVAYAGGVGCQESNSVSRTLQVSRPGNCADNRHVSIPSTQLPTSLAMSFIASTCLCAH